MISFPQRVFLYKHDADMRKSFNGLLNIVQSEFQMDVLAGDMFLFIGKRKDRLKALWWDGDGLAIFLKRLEKGNYQRPLVVSEGCYAVVDRTQLQLMLSGIELTSVKQRPRYSRVVSK